MNERIAVVEDDPDIRRLLVDTLEDAGYRVSGYANAEVYLAQTGGRWPDLLILDIMLPGMDGLDLCRKLRKDDRATGLTIILLTARDTELDKVLGLELGADDYVTKPFSPRELLARARAVLRRGRAPEETPVMELGGTLSVDQGKFEATVDGRRADLTATEFRLLAVLMEKKGRVLTRDQLLDCLWGSEKTVTDRTIDAHVKKIREKLGPAGRFVKSVRGVGYKIEG